MLNRRKAIAALSASAAIAFLSLAFAQPSHAVTTLGPYVIENTASGLCVQPDPANPGPDIQLMQQSCFTDATQTTIRPGAQWMFLSIDGGDVNFRVQNLQTGDCMRALSNTDLSPVDSIDCTSISNERWSLQAAPSGGHLELISRVSNGGRCLDVRNNLLTPTTIDIFHCTSNSSNTNTAQTFFIQPRPAPADS